MPFDESLTLTFFQMWYILIVEVNISSGQSVYCENDICGVRRLSLVRI
jgi:hypothetical protein